MSDKSESKKANPIETALMLSLIVLVYIVLFPFLLPHIARDISLRLKFRKVATGQGKFILFVYSDSPNWKSYIERNILPHIQDHAIVLNWSERNQWDKTSWQVQAFVHWGGQKDFNPLAVVFCGLTKVRTIRFYQAFHDFKHGKEISLHQAETQLLELVRAKTTFQMPYSAA